MNDAMQIDIRKMRNALLMPVLMVITAMQVFAAKDSTRYLQPRSEHLKEAKLVVQILDHFHYRDTDLDDSLSSVIFDNFINSLDANKNYFLASDIQSFQKYRFSLDENLKKGNLVPPYYLFNIYKKRVESRLDYALARVKQDFDYSKDEFYDFDRENATYAQTEEEQDELWRKILKSQALNLKLSGSEEGKVSELLTGRYERFANNVSKYNSNDVFEIFMNSVTEAFDPHTNYFTPLSAEDFKRQSSKTMEGIGATLLQDKDYTKIIELRPGGPAFLSGQINKDDRVVGVAQGAEGDMINVVGWRSDEVAGKIRGPKGTLVRLELLPAGALAGGETKIVSIVRDKIKYDEARAQSKVIPYEEHGVKYKLGVITIPDFYLNAEELDEGVKDYVSTTNDVKRLIGEFEEQGVDGVLLDLRNNGGGALFEAINLSGLFLPGGPVVQVKYANGRIEKGNDDDETMFYDGPLNVIINRFSASASEIFAGAIQDYHRGVVVGEQTYGKGTVQNVRQLNDFVRQPTEEQLGLLKYTIAKFYRVTGNSTQHLGVTPDILFPSAYNSSEFGESSKPSALPWDKISSAPYQPLNFVDNHLIDVLNKEHLKRLKTDQSMLDYQFDINEFKKSRKLKQVSLNYEVRKKEQEARKQRKAERVKVGGSLGELETNKAADDHALDDLKDPYLKESIILLAAQIDNRKKKG